MPPEVARLRAVLLQAEVARLAPEARGARVRTVLSKEPELISGLAPGGWAALAPDSVWVYDATALAALAPDMPVGVVEYGNDPAKPAGEFGVDSRIVRFADDLRRALPRGWVLVHPAGAVLVAHPAGSDAEVDAAIDRASRVGSGIARLEVDLLPEQDVGLPLDIGAAGSPWTKTGSIPPSFPGSAPTERYERAGAAEFAASPQRLHLDVPSGSRCGSKRTTATSYVQDFDNEIGSVLRWSEPVIGTIEAGFSVNATHQPASASEVASLTLGLTWSDLVEPIPTFTATTTPFLPAVTIDLPELRLQRVTVSMPAVRGTAIFVPMRVVGFLVRVASIEPMAPPTGHLVRRVRAGEPFPAPGAFPEGNQVPSTYHITLSRSPSSADPRSGACDATASLDVTSGAGESVTTAVTRSVSYISDFDVELASPALIADPIIGTIASGVEVGLRSRSLEGGSSVAVGAIRFTHLDLPMRRYTFSVAVGKPLTTLQLPRTRMVVESFAANFAPGGSNRWSLIGPAGPNDATIVDVRAGERSHDVLIAPGSGTK